MYIIDDIPRNVDCEDCDSFDCGGFGDFPSCLKTRYGNKYAACIEIKEEVITQSLLHWYLYTNNFGKTVFLTREDAEAAMKERENNG